MGRLKRLLFPVLSGLAVYYAVFGGEHTMLDLHGAAAAIETETAVLVGLQEDIDSLSARVDSLENDPVTLEQVARERYGMIRDGEILYRFADPVDEGGSSRSGS